MGTLKPFSEKDRQHYEHQARQDCLREQHTIQKELKAERQEKEAALAELEREKTRLVREVGRLQALVRAAERTIREA